MTDTSGGDDDEGAAPAGAPARGVRAIGRRRRSGPAEAKEPRGFTGYMGRPVSQTIAARRSTVLLVVGFVVVGALSLRFPPVSKAPANGTNVGGNPFLPSTTTTTTVPPSTTTTTTTVATTTTTVPQSTTTTTRVPSTTTTTTTRVPTTTTTTTSSTLATSSSTTTTTVPGG